MFLVRGVVIIIMIHVYLLLLLLQLTDLMFFFCILVVVMLAYGVISQALRFPNQPPSLVLLKEIVYKPYWQIYGELFLDEVEGNVLPE